MGRTRQTYADLLASALRRLIKSCDRGEPYLPPHQGPAVDVARQVLKFYEAAKRYAKKQGGPRE